MGDGDTAGGGADHYRLGDEIPPQCQLCQILGYRGDFINEPTHSTEIANAEGGSKIVYHCRRCGLEMWGSDKTHALTDEIEGCGCDEVR